MAELHIPHYLVWAIVRPKRQKFRKMLVKQAVLNAAMVCLFKTPRLESNSFKSRADKKHENAFQAKNKFGPSGGTYLFNSR